MKTFRRSAAQGEVNVRRVLEMPAGLLPVAPENGKLIVGHSESGHHHFLPDIDGVTVMESPGAPEGMKVFYALLKEPTALGQDASEAHETIMLGAGVFEIRISREFDPFAEQARRVAD